MSGLAIMSSMVAGVANMAVLTDGGEDFAGDPATELCSLGLVAADDDLVEACFAYEEGFSVDTSIVDELTQSKVI